MFKHVLNSMGSKLDGNIPIHIWVSDDLTRLVYSKVLDDSKVFCKDGRVDYSKLVLDEKPLLDIPSSFLLYPVLYIAKTFQHELLEHITQIMQMNKRYTTYQEITTSWDKQIDRDVWTTSIDTVYFHRVIKESGILNDPNTHTVTEAGVGGGHLSAMVAAETPSLWELRISDISQYAIDSAVRNIKPYLKPTIIFKSYLGKGIWSFDNDTDLLLVNPPYIPTAPWITVNDGDPYRGTGLIKEIFKLGVSKLRTHQNPNASIVMNVSSLASKDIEGYENLYGDQLLIEDIGAPIWVPLKIGGVDQKWTRWLLDEGLLCEKVDAKPEESKYWHQIKVIKIKKLK
jgi:hypothetical protein